MKVHVFSDSTVCVGVSQIQIHPIIGKQKEDAWNEHGFVRPFNLAAREVQVISHVLRGASALDIKRHLQIHLNGQTPDSFDDRIIFRCYVRRH